MYVLFWYQDSEITISKSINKLKQFVKKNYEDYVGQFSFSNHSGSKNIIWVYDDENDEFGIIKKVKEIL